MTSGVVLPGMRGLYYGGEWHTPMRVSEVDVTSPATGELITKIQEGSEADVPAAVAAAQTGFELWRHVSPLERAKILRQLGAIIRKHADELAMLDALDGGNPVTALKFDTEYTAFSFDYFAGLVTEMKGHSVPAGPGTLSFSTREPHGVVARIAPFNHPLIFSVAKIAPALAAGNAIIVKPPEQAPLSALRVAELFEGVLPPGVFNVLPGTRQLGAALVAHPGVAMIAVTGSVYTGKAIMRSAADGLKRVLLELGGKNALIAYPDCDPAKIAAAMVSGMNFAWCGQSCGSTSRAFVHADIYDRVLDQLPEHARKYRPGLPTDPATTMGSLIDKTHFERVKAFIDSAKSQGARLIHGGSSPMQESLRNGCFLDPTIFADVTMKMRIAREEIFGPVLAVLRWSDEEEMLRQVNELEYGLTCAVWTRDIARAHRVVARVEAGYCWINDVARHVQGSPFGGYKQSGLGREECLDELLAFTQEKNVILNLEN